MAQRISISFVSLSLCLSLLHFPASALADIQHHRRRDTMHRTLTKRGGLLSNVVGGVGDTVGGAVNGLGTTVSKLGGGGDDGSTGSGKHNNTNLVTALGDTVSNVGSGLGKAVNKLAGQGSPSSGGSGDNSDSSTGSDEPPTHTGHSGHGGSSSGTPSGPGATTGSQGSNGSPGTGGSPSNGTPSNGDDGSDTPSSPNKGSSAGSDTSTTPKSGGDGSVSQASGDAPSPDADPAAGGEASVSTVSPGSESANSPPNSKAVISSGGTSGSEAQDDNGGAADGAVSGTAGNSQEPSEASQASIISPPSSSSLLDPLANGATSAPTGLPSIGTSTSDHPSSSHAKAVIVPVVVVCILLALGIIAVVIRKRSKSRQGIRLGDADFTPVNRANFASPIPAGAAGSRRLSEESFVAGRPVSAYTVDARSEMSERSYGNGNPFAAPLTSSEPYTDANPLFYDPASAHAGVANLALYNHSQQQSILDSSDSVNGYDTATEAAHSNLFYDGSAEGGSAPLSYSSHGMDLAGTSGAPQHYSPYSDVHRASVGSVISSSESSHDRHYRIRTSRLYPDAQDPFADSRDISRPPQAVNSSRWSS